jgi:hypothetical protein
LPNCQPHWRLAGQRNGCLSIAIRIRETQQRGCDGSAPKLPV